MLALLPLWLACAEPPEAPAPPTPAATHDPAVLAHLRVDELVAALNTGEPAIGALLPLGSAKQLQDMSVDLKAAFPDAVFNVEQVVTQGDRVVARVGFQGTHTGPLLDLKPTGQAVQTDFTWWMRVDEAGQINEWEVSGGLTQLFLQVGRFPKVPAP